MSDSQSKGVPTKMHEDRAQELGATMAQALDAVDISDNPELLRIVGDARLRNAPLILRRRGEAVAILMPLGNGDEIPGRRTKTQEDDEAFLRSAGSWKDLVDADKLIEDIYESRGRPSRASPDR